MELLCDQLAASGTIPLKPAATHTSASSLIFGRNQAGMVANLSKT
jgi:hypothetical protein